MITPMDCAVYLYSLLFVYRCFNCRPLANYEVVGLTEEEKRCQTFLYTFMLRQGSDSQSRSIRCAGMSG